MKLWKSKKNSSNNNNNNNTSSTSTISCVPGKSSTLVKDNNDTKSDVATTSSTNVSGKLMICNPGVQQLYGINETTDGFTMAIQTNKRINYCYYYYSFNHTWSKPKRMSTNNVYGIWRMALTSMLRYIPDIFLSSMKRPIDRKSFGI